MLDTLALPALDPRLRREAERHGVTTVFKIWDGVLEAGLGRTENSTTGRAAVVTVDDAVFLGLVTGHRGYEGVRPFVDPFMSDPPLQRLVVACQVAARAPDTIPAEVATVGGRTLQFTEDPDGTLYVNGVRVVNVVASDDGPGPKIYVLEKILWIRPEDIESGIVRLTERA